MNKDKFRNNQELIQMAYTAFNARDIDTILTIMHPHIKWARAWEGEYAIGHDEIRSYWTRQWNEINPKVTPVDFTERSDGTFEVLVDQLVKDPEGNVLFDGKVKHVYVINDGLLHKMDIESA